VERRDKAQVFGLYASSQGLKAGSGFLAGSLIPTFNKEVKK